MRFELNLTRTSKQRMLPMDYEYYISAWIYKVIRQADEEFADFLHDEGYGNANKAYKLFCFDRLNFGRPTLWKDKHLFEIRQEHVHLHVSFDVKEAATHFIKGLFIEQEFYLGDRFNGIDFKVEQVVVLDEPLFVEKMHYRLQSPWVVSYQDDNDKYAQYLSPNDERFVTLAAKHILEKGNSIHRLNLQPEDITLSLTSDYKRTGFLIKPGTKAQTKVLGNIFSFELEAPLAVHQMVWNAGVSEKSALGFGWVELINM